jgi:glycerol-3-phosphate O-acyltransferase
MIMELKQICEVVEPFMTYYGVVINDSAKIIVEEEHFVIFIENNKYHIAMLKEHWTDMSFDMDRSCEYIGEAWHSVAIATDELHEMMDKREVWEVRNDLNHPLHREFMDYFLRSEKLLMDYFLA